jgi:integral membrane protein
LRGRALGAPPARRAGARPGNWLGTVAGWFRLVALAEAVSWVGLLIGMYFKYLGSPRTEIGVKVFGMVHGLIFIAFVVTGLLAGIAFKWAVRTWLLALLASIVPLCSVIFLIWADRTGRIGSSAVTVEVTPPGGSLPETT